MVGTHKKLDPLRTTALSITATSTAARAMDSVKAWTSEEKTLASRAFVRASENARTGVYQTKAVFKERIQETFLRIQKERTGGSPKYGRNGSGLFERYKKIKKECISF